MKTKLLYWQDQGCLAMPVTTIDKGIDEKGAYLSFDKTIIYPSGGGQPLDVARLFPKQDAFVEVVASSFNSGVIRYYIDLEQHSLFNVGESVVQWVDGYTRQFHSALHTTGHWIAQVVTENLMLPWTPLKGHHYPGQAYVGFKGDTNLISNDLIDHVNQAMWIDFRSNFIVSTEIVNDPKVLASRNALLPSNYIPSEDKPIRISTIESYRPLPCGGTHLNSLRELKSFRVTKVKVKNGVIRISYSCSINNRVAT